MAATTTTSYSVLSLGEESAAAAERGFGLDDPIDPETGRRGRRLRPTRLRRRLVRRERVLPGDERRRS